MPSARITSTWAGHCSIQVTSRPACVRSAAIAAPLAPVPTTAIRLFPIPSHSHRVLLVRRLRSLCHIFQPAEATSFPPSIIAAVEDNPYGKRRLFPDRPEPVRILRVERHGIARVQFKGFGPDPDAQPAG